MTDEPTPRRRGKGIARDPEYAAIIERLAKLEGALDALCKVVVFGAARPEHSAMAASFTQSDVKQMTARTHAALARAARGLPRDVIGSIKQQAWEWTQEGVEEADIIRRIERGVESAKIDTAMGVLDG